MRRYESVVILDPELADDDIVNFTERYSNLIKSTGGEIIKIEDWGAKRLAYLVKKKDKGRYILFDFVGLPALIRELERQFKISDEVMKFLSVKLDEEVDLEAFKAASVQEEAVKEPEPEATEETEAEEAAQPVAQPEPTDSGAAQATEEAAIATEATEEAAIATEATEEAAIATEAAPTPEAGEQQSEATEQAPVEPQRTEPAPAAESTKEGE